MKNLYDLFRWGLIPGLLVPWLTSIAHVELDYPAGGETFHPGQTVTVAWHEIVQHNTANWDIYFSSDGGNSWQIVKMDLGPGTFYYDWIVPEELTDQGRIKVVQDNMGANYEDESENFSIAQSSGTSALSAGIPIVVYPNPTTGFFQVTSKSNAAMDELYLIGPGGKVLEFIDVSGQPMDQTGSKRFLEGYAPGIYFLNAFSEGRRTSIKIIKN